MRVLAVVATGPGVADGARPALDPLDLALVRGDAVFEALRVYAGRPFRLREHLDRLGTSAAAVELPLPGGLEELAARAVAEAGAGDAVLRLICTRGPEGEGGPAAFAICTDIPASFETDRRRGLRLVLLTTAADPLVRAASPWLLPGV
ncbi:MAG TPA: aminotransferase class IV, partial [Actinomycetes bacterium]|nr:aminotransferase class IV [Actinomycetes bacterium]